MYLPLNSPITYPATQAFARRVAETLAAEQPTLMLAENAKSLRTNRVLVDWGQNSPYKSNVSVYSLRATDELAFVSAPVTWEEIEQSVETGDAGRLKFTSEALVSRIQRMGDLFLPVLTLRQELPQKLG